MATSGSTSVAVTSYDTLKFSWSLSSQSTANNTSTISWTMQLIAGSSGRISSTASKSWSVTVNGTNYSGTNTVGIANGETKTLASGTTTIAHNSDGTKTFSYSFSQQFSITFSGSSIGTKSGSGSGTLTTIPRASTLTVSNGTLNTAQTLTITRADSTFKHKITYVCGSTSGYVAGSSTAFTTATSVSWTPPLSLANQNTTGTSLSCTLYLKTYNSSGTQIGSVTKAITLSIPASVKPTVSLAVSDAMGYLGTYGAYVQSKSKLAITVTSAGSYGSTIKTRKTTFDGSSYTTASITTSVIKGTGTLSVSCTVTDSRGRTATASTNISSLAYAAPKLSSVKAIRCTSDGTASSSGAYLKLSFNAAITALNNKNTAAYTVQYKKASATSYTSATLTAYAGTYSVSGGSYIFAADTASSYDVVLTATDAFSSGQTSVKGASISKLWSILAKGKGIAIGKVAEAANVLEVAWASRFRSTLSVGNREGYQDGKTGVYLHPDGYIQIQRASTGGTTPYIGFYLDDNTNLSSSIRHNAVTNAMEFAYSSGGYRFSTTTYVGGALYVNANKTAWNDGVSGWSLHTNGTAHATHATGGGSIEFHYAGSTNATSKIKETASGTISINSMTFGTNKVLWSGGWYMTAAHSITLSEAISAQANGIVLVFSPYSSGAVQNYYITYHFVPKFHIQTLPGIGVSFEMFGSKFDDVATKYLYINDTTITGNDANSATGESQYGISYNNSFWVLRYVIGV